MSGALLPWWGWMLVLQAILVAALFEYVRRLPMRPTSGEISASVLDGATHASELDYQPDTLDRAGVIEPSRIAEMIDAKLHEFLATTLRAEFSAHSHLHEYDKRMAALSNQARQAFGSATLAFDFTKEEVAKLQTRIGEIAKGCSDLERRLNDWTRQHCDDQDQRFKNVDGGFRAIRDRETLENLAEKIRSQADGLLRTSRGERVENWGVWNNQNFQWQQDIMIYGGIAAHYLADVPSLIGDVPSHSLRGDWTEDRSLFPSDDAVIAHRTTAVTMQNFNKQHERVLKCVTSFAFDAPSMKGIANS